VAALKAERRRGTTAICRSRPWKHKLGICRASTCNYEASAPTIAAIGGRRQRGHDDGASRRNTGEPVSGAAALPSATSEQRRRGDVVGSRRSYGRDGGGARCSGRQWQRRHCGGCCAACCGGERRKQEMEWWRWEAHGVRCGFKTEDPGSGSGQPRRVAWAVSRPATRAPHAAVIF